MPLNKTILINGIRDFLMPDINMEGLTQEQKTYITNYVNNKTNQLANVIESYVKSGTVKFVPGTINAGVTTVDVVQVDPMSHMGGGTGTGTINGGNGDQGIIY